MALALMLGSSCSRDSRTNSGQQCTGLPELQPSCDCTESQQCFVVSDSYEVCSTPNEQEATSCSSSPSVTQRDQCGCDGAVCPQEQSCRPIRETVSGGSFTQNHCYSVCQNTSECSNGQICLPNRFEVATCMTPECSTDADCSEDDCGHCVRERWLGGQGMVWGNAPRCVYEGNPDSSSCGGSGFLRKSGPSPHYPQAEVHTCHAWIVDEP
jgi:hypothetical protein